jgi:hypothetical protein
VLLEDLWSWAPKRLNGSDHFDGVGRDTADYLLSARFVLRRSEIDDRELRLRVLIARSSSIVQDCQLTNCIVERCSQVVNDVTNDWPKVRCRGNYRTESKDVDVALLIVFSILVVKIPPEKIVNLTIQFIQM